MLVTFLISVSSHCCEDYGLKKSFSKNEPEERLI